MRWPKLRELREAVTVLLAPRFTTKFPAEPCAVPEAYRGKPEFDTEACIGCGACVNVCPTLALTMTDEVQGNPPKRTITARYDTCIFCGNCQDNCTTQKGIRLTRQWDLATLDRRQTVSTYDFELQRCEKCHAVIGTKKHLVWLAAKLGPLAYMNPSILLARDEAMFGLSTARKPPEDAEPSTADFTRILCPRCKAALNLCL